VSFEFETCGGTTGMIRGATPAKAGDGLENLHRVRQVSLHVLARSLNPGEFEADVCVVAKSPI
jgi:hypothetical protein